MASKRGNALRDYHLLIVRSGEGFEWQIRYNRHANPVQRSQVTYSTQAEALTAGEATLGAIKREGNSPEA